MRRREFIAGLGSAAAWPVVASAENMPVLGYLYSASATASPHLMAAFRQGLHETGFIEGQNVAIEFRWAENRFEQLPALVDDLRCSRLPPIPLRLLGWRTRATLAGSPVSCESDTAAL